MDRDVVEFIGQCVICQQIKPDNHAPYGLL